MDIIIFEFCMVIEYKNEGTMQFIFPMNRGNFLCCEAQNAEIGVLKICSK